MKLNVNSLVIITIGILCSLPISAQIDVEQKAKDASIDRADQRTDEGIDKGLDAVEDGVKSLFTKKPKSKKEKTESSEASNEENNSEEAAPKTVKPTAAKQEPEQLKSFTKYDFVPGDQVLLYDDFSQDEVGDFPGLWTTSGSGEVRTLNNYPGKWLYMNANSASYVLMKDLALPENFIFEFDVVPTAPEDDENSASFWFTLYKGEGEFLNTELYPGDGGVSVTLSSRNWEARGYLNISESKILEGYSELAPVQISKSSHVIVWVQKRRLRIYHMGQKVLDLPTIMYDEIKCNRLRFNLWGCVGLHYISNIRFTTAKPDTRNKLLTEGKLVTYGIYFDVNSDKLKPESYGTLKDIAVVLNEVPDVKVKIYGHTDADGDDAKNLDLSKRRAASVKNELVNSFGVKGDRIETDGLGETKPIAPNDTPANKAKNRRVEFIKL